MKIQKRHRSTCKPPPRSGKCMTGTAATFRTSPVRPFFRPCGRVGVEFNFSRKNCEISSRNYGLHYTDNSITVAGKRRNPPAARTTASNGAGGLRRRVRGSGRRSPVPDRPRALINPENYYMLGIDKTDEEYICIHSGQRRGRGVGLAP